MKNDQVGGTEEERPFLSASIPGCKPGEWDEGLALRETFLMYFAEEPAEFLRWLANKYASWMFENDRYIDPSFRDSTLAVEVQALADKIDTRINPKRKAKKNV